MTLAGDVIAKRDELVSAVRARGITVLEVPHARGWSAPIAIVAADEPWIAPSDHALAGWDLAYAIRLVAGAVDNAAAFATLAELVGSTLEATWELPGWLRPSAGAARSLDIDGGTYLVADVRIDDARRLLEEGSWSWLHP